MAETRTIELNIVDNANQTQQQFENLRQQIAKTTQEVDELTQAYGENSQEVTEAKGRLNELTTSYTNLNKVATDTGATFADVYGEMQPLTTRMGEAEDRLYELALAGKTATQEYKDLLAATQNYLRTQQQVDLQVDAGSMPAAQKMTMAVGGVAGAFSVAEGTAALFGTESQKLAETMLKLQAAMTITQGLVSFKEALPIFTDMADRFKKTAIGQSLLTAATTTYNVVVGASTGLMKAFRIALLSTGIGALVVGIGLLIANFDKVIALFKPLIDGFKAIGDFIGITDFAAKEKAKNDKKRTEEELKQLAKIRAAREKNFNNEQAAYDREIKLQQALGKNTLELQKQKINASIKYQETKKKELEQELLGLKILFENNKLFKDLANEGFTNYENQINQLANSIADQKTELKILDIEAKKAEQAPSPITSIGGGGGITPQEKTDIDITRRVEDEKLRIREESRQKDLDSLALNYKRKLEDAKNELKDDKDKKAKLANLEKQYQESIKADIQAIDEKWDKIEKEAREKKLEEQIKLEDEQYNALQKAQNSAREQELFELMQSYDAKFELAKNNAELEKALTEQFNAEQAAIIQKYRKEEEEKKKEEDEKELERLEELNKAKFQLAYDGLQLVSELSSLFGAQDEKKAKLAFQVDKAAKISSATIAGYEAVLEAYKTGQKSPLTVAFPAYPYVQAGLAGAFAAVNIAKIAKSKFQSSGGSMSTSGGGGGGGAAAPMTANFNTIGSSGINQLAQLQQTPTQAYVVSTEVTSAQALDRNRVQNATL